MSRPGFPDYFMRLAYLAATRATCPRKHVGAVMVNDDHRVIATGYNGAPSGMPSCDEVGCEIIEGHCQTAVHSEINCISDAGRLAKGCTLYCVCIPCWDCAKSIANVGIRRVVYDQFYPSRYGLSDKVPAFLRAAKVEVVQHDSIMLSAFKKKLEELETLEADVLATQLVEYQCGCTAPSPAPLLCPNHKKGARVVRS